MQLLLKHWRKRLDKVYWATSAQMKQALIDKSPDLDRLWAECAYLKSLEREAERLEEMAATVGQTGATTAPQTGPNDAPAV